MTKPPNIKDSDRVAFIAMEAGTFEYSSVGAGKKTIAAYDVGVAYDPTGKGADGKVVILSDVVMVEESQGKKSSVR